ncbi:MAG: hypothetical protein WAS27_04000 [Candidatus Saccharimonadales bacterium]
MTVRMDDYRNSNNFEANTMPSRESEDFLCQEFYNPVVETDVIYEDETSKARILKERVTMDNGARYDVTSTLAKQRTIDIGIVATAAWLTQDQGINKDRALRAANIGIDTVFISPQQNLDRIGHFGRSVCNIISIADYMHFRDDRDPDHLWVDGISRGGMHALGVAAKAPYVNGKRVIAGDYTVPCFPDGINLGRDLSQLPRLVMNEFSALTAFTRLPLTAMLRYPRTFAADPKMLFQHAKEVPTLLSGATGDAARNMPSDTFGHVTNYMGDIMGQGRRWEPIFEPYNNITVENFKGGGHLSLVDMRCQGKWEQRLRAVHEIIASDPSIVTASGDEMCEAVRSTGDSGFRHRGIAA